MKKIMLTGSSGYIGQNFIKLYGDTYDIVEIDRKIDKPISSIKTNELRGIKHVVHLAAISGIQSCEEDKKQTITDNVLTLNNIWMMSTVYNIPVTFASSQAAKDGGNTYSFTKMIGEQFLMNDNNDNVCILRLSNVYGGLNYLETKTSVVSNFINASKNDLPLYVNGNGTQIRDFIHVDDVCKAIHLSIQLKEKSNMILDIGTGIPVSIYDLAMFIDSAGVLFKKNVNVGVKGNVADPIEAEKMLGFKTEKGLLSYLKEI